MAYELAHAVVSLSVSTRGIGKQIVDEIDGVQSRADKAGQGIGTRLMGAMGKTLKVGALGAGTAAGAALGASMVKGLGRLDGIEQAEAKLSGLGHSAQAVGAIMDNALTSVRGTAFGLDEAATVAASAVAAGIEPGQELERVLGLTGDAATIAGVSMAEMGDIFNKVASSNKMQGDVINQLNTAGIPIVQLLGQELGKTSEEITEMSRKGQIDFQMFADAMESGLGGAALKSGDTFRGALANMGAAAGRFGAEVLRPLHERGKDAFGGLTGLIDDATERVKPLAAAFGGWLDDTGPKLLDLGRSAGQAFSEFRRSDRVRDSLHRLGGVLTQVMDTGRRLGPSIATIAESLGKAAAATGLSTWKIFLSGLESVAKIADVTLVPALRTLATLMEKNQGAVTALMAGFLAFKTVPNLVTRVSTAFAPVGAAAKGARTGVKDFAGALQDSWRWAGQANPEMGKFGRAATIAGANASAAFRGVKGALGGVVTALGGPVGIGLIATGLAVSSVASVNARVEASAKRMADEIDRAKKAQIELAEAFRNSGGIVDGNVFDIASRDVDAMFSYLNDQASESVSRLDKLKAVFSDIVQFRSEWQSHHALLQTEYDAQIAQETVEALREAGISATEYTRALVGSRSAAAALIEQLKTDDGKETPASLRFRQLRDEYQELQNQAKTLTPGMGELSDAVGVLADSAASASDRAGALRRALEALGIIEPDISQAMADFGETVDRMADQTLGSIEAADGLGQAMLNADGSLNTFANAGAREVHSQLSELIDRFLTAAAVSGDAQAEWDKLAPALAGLADATQLPIEEIERLAGSYGGVPETVQTLIDLKGSDEAQQAVAQFLEKAKTIEGDGPINVEMFVEDAGAQQALHELVDMVTVINAETGQVSVRLDDREGLAKLEGFLGQLDQMPDVVTVEVDADGEAARIQLLEIIDLAQDEEKDVLIDSNAAEQIELLEALGIEIVDMKDGTFKITDNVPEVRARLDELKRPTASEHTVYVSERFMSGTGRTGTPRAAVGQHYADGGIRGLPDQAMIAPGRGAGLVQWAEGETGGEAFIPLAPSKRARSLSILEEVARRFGVGLTSYADGGIRAAISAARSKEGLPYVWGGTGPGGFDCSGFIGFLQQIVMGVSEVEAAGKRLYTTHSLLGGATAGLVRGDDPSSPFRVGVSDGHMAGTLAGQNVESGGASSPSSSGIGPGRAGADHPQFTARFHLPASLVDSGDGSAVDSWGMDAPMWSEDDDRRLADARAALQQAMQARDRAYAENRSDLDKEAADLRVQRAELDVRELEQKREGLGGASSMLVSAAPAIDGAMDEDAIRLRQAEIAVLDAQLSRDQTYSDPSSTTLDKEKADLALYSAQNALAREQEEAAGRAEGGSVRSILTDFAAATVGGLIDDVWDFLGISEPKWMSVDIPRPTRPGRPAQTPSVHEALADRPAHFSDAEVMADLPVPREGLEEWIRKHGIPLHDDGGWLMPGLTLNLTRKPEPVLSPEQLDALYRVADAGATAAEGAAAGPTFVTNATFRDEREFWQQQAQQQRVTAARMGV